MGDDISNRRSHSLIVSLTHAKSSGDSIFLFTLFGRVFRLYERGVYEVVAVVSVMIAVVVP